jgi:hypothetical protein
MELKAESRAESGFPQGTLLPIIRSPGPDEALCSTVPAMSDEPERVFSGARRTITWDKAQMEPDTIEIRECLKQWKKSKILNQIVIED